MRLQLPYCRIAVAVRSLVTFPVTLPHPFYVAVAGYVDLRCTLRLHGYGCTFIWFGYIAHLRLHAVTTFPVAGFTLIPHVADYIPRVTTVTVDFTTLRLPPPVALRYRLRLRWFTYVTFTLPVVGFPFTFCSYHGYILPFVAHGYHTRPLRLDSPPVTLRFTLILIYRLHVYPLRLLLVVVYGCSFTLPLRYPITLRCRSPLFALYRCRLIYVARCSYVVRCVYVRCRCLYVTLRLRYRWLHFTRFAGCLYIVVALLLVGCVYVTFLPVYVIPRVPVYVVTLRVTLIICTLHWILRFYLHRYLRYVYVTLHLRYVDLRSAVTLHVAGYVDLHCRCRCLYVLILLLFIVTFYLLPRIFTLVLIEFPTPRFDYGCCWFVRSPVTRYVYGYVATTPVYGYHHLCHRTLRYHPTPPRLDSLPHLPIYIALRLRLRCCCCHYRYDLPDFVGSLQLRLPHTVALHRFTHFVCCPLRYLHLWLLRYVILPFTFLQLPLRISPLHCVGCYVTFVYILRFLRYRVGYHLYIYVPFSPFDYSSYIYVTLLIVVDSLIYVYVVTRYPRLRCCSRD